MRSERVSDAGGSCELARRWGLSPAFARMLLTLEEKVSSRVAANGARWPGLWIISGRRQAPVPSALNPDQPAAEESLHLACPALAADLRVGNQPASLTDPSVWALVGVEWETLGGRWGGRFNPPDWNHFDAPMLAGGMGGLITDNPRV